MLEIVGFKQDNITKEYIFEIKDIDGNTYYWSCSCPFEPSDINYRRKIINKKKPKDFKQFMGLFKNIFKPLSKVDRSKKIQPNQKDIEDINEDKNIVDIELERGVDPSVLEDLGYNVKESMYSNSTIQTSDIPSRIEKSIRSLQNQIQEGQLYNGEDEEGWVENGIQKLLHITVLYGIEDKNIPTVQKISTLFEPISINIEGIDYFDHDDKSVLILKCNSFDLQKLHDFCDYYIPDNKHSYKDYKPHITLAYLNKDERIQLDFKPDKFDINTIEVCKSDGNTEKFNLSKQNIELTEKESKSIYKSFLWK